MSDLRSKLSLALSASGVAFAGALMVFTGKMAGKRVNTFEQMGIRSLLCFAAMPWLPGGTGAQALLRTKSPRWMLVRGSCGFLAQICYFEAVKNMPLALVALLTRLHPLFGAVIASIMLNERLNKLHLAGLLIGALGAAIAAPAKTWSLASVNTGSTYGFVCCMLAAAMTSGAIVTVRKLAVLGEDKRAIMLSFHLCSCFGGFGVGVYKGLVVPSLAEFAWICGTAVAATAMQWALAATTASVMADSLPFFFLSVVFNMFFGLLAGDPLPAQREVVGAVFIVFAVSLSIHAKEQKSKTHAET